MNKIPSICIHHCARIHIKQYRPITPSSDPNKQRDISRESSQLLQKESGGVTWLQILSYQRSGSTITARIFDADPDAFYVFEPLDLTYVAMYAIKPGKNPPDDIFFENNGSQR